MSYYGACKGITKAGKPCLAVVVHENGFCRVHGGQGYPTRDRMLLTRAIKRSERWARKADAWMARAAKADPRFAAMLVRVKAAKEGKAEPQPLPLIEP